MLSNDPRHPKGFMRLSHWIILCHVHQLYERGLAVLRGEEPGYQSGGKASMPHSYAKMRNAKAQDIPCDFRTQLLDVVAFHPD